MDPADDRWEWHRWQLVRLDTDPAGDTVTVDFIELAHGGDPGDLVTLSVPLEDGPGEEDGHALLLTLQRWAEDDDGLCDAFRCVSGTEELALVQGDTTVVLRGDGLLPGDVDPY